MPKKRIRTVDRNGVSRVRVPADVVDEMISGRSFTKFTTKLGNLGLYVSIEQRAFAHGVSLRDLYEGPIKAPSIVRARRDVYKWLMKNGKGLNEVARIFDRAPSGVWKMTRGIGARK